MSRPDDFVEPPEPNDEELAAMSENKTPTPRTNAKVKKGLTQGDAVKWARELEQELQSAQKSEQDCRQIITTYCEESDGQRLLISQLQEEKARLIDDARQSEQYLAHLKGEIGRLREALELRNQQLIQGEYNPVLDKSQPAGETFVPWSVVKQVIPILESQGTMEVNYMDTIKTDLLARKLRSYAPKSEVKG